MNHRRRSAGFVAIALTSQLAPAALAQPAAPALSTRNADPAKPKRAWRLSITGDLVCSSLATRIGEEFARAKAARAEAVIVQLSAQRWRSDIVLAVAQAIRNSDVPIHIILKPVANERVGLGALIVGLSGASLWMTPGSTISNADPDRVASIITTVKDVKAENTSLTEDIDLALSRRAAPVELGPLLVTPTGPRWLIGAGNTPRIVDDDRESPDAVPIITSEADGVRLQLSAQHALAARLIDGIRGGDSVFKHMGFLPARPKAEPALRDEFAFSADATLACDPASEYRETCAALGTVDDSIARVQTLLDPPGKGKPTTTAKSEADLAINDAKRSLEELERRLKDAPELAQQPVPGQTEVGVKPANWPTKWRSAIQKRRDQLGRLSAKAK